MVTRSARRGIAPAGALAAIATALVLLASPPPAGAVTHEQADEIALKTLKAKKAGQGVALFASPKAVKKGSVVGESGADGTGAPKAKTLKDKAYLYWFDLSYGAMFEHPSTLLLLDAKTGKKVWRRDMTWTPVVDGRAPPFLATADGYRSDRYQVYSDEVVGIEPAARAADRPPRSQRSVPAGTFDYDCMVMVGPKDLPIVAGNFVAMKKWADSVGIKTDYASTVGQLKVKVDELIEAGCQDVFIYITGHGRPPPGWKYKGKTYKGGPPAVDLGNSGDQAVGASTNTITPLELEEILKAYPAYEFKVKIDSCFAGRWKDLRSNRNLRVLELSSAADQTSQGYLPNAPYKKKNGKIVKWSKVADNPDGATEFTNGDIHGLEAWAASATQQTEHPGLAGAIEASMTLGRNFNYSAGVIPSDKPGHTDPEVYTNPPLLTQPPPITPLSPNASFTSSPNSPPSAPKAGQTVNFDGSASSDPDGTITSYHWQVSGPKFGGGGSPSITSSDGPNTSVSFSQPGVYTVTLTVTDAGGHTGTTSQDVFVSGPGTKTETVADIPCGGGVILSVDINIPTFAEGANLTSPAIPPPPVAVPGCPGLFIDSITVSTVMGSAPLKPATDEWGQETNHLHAVVTFSGASGAPGPGVVPFTAGWN